jgi:hypothetical protein
MNKAKLALVIFVVPALLVALGAAMIIVGTFLKASGM